MPFDPQKNPWGLSVQDRASSLLGRKGGLVTPSDTQDLATYARIRVFAPASLAAAAIKILPMENADDAPITLSVPPGAPVVLEYLVRRVFSTGSTAGLEIHAVL